MKERIMEIIIGSDHGGFQLKKSLINYLESQNFKIKDMGTKNNKSVDYPIFAHKVAKEVLKKGQSFGIVICGTGIGISIAINRHKGIRCALVKTKKESIMSRKHNDSNVLALGGRTTSLDKAKKIVDSFFSTSFEGGRHKRRIEEIEEF